MRGYCEYAEENEHKDLYSLSNFQKLSIIHRSAPSQEQSFTLCVLKSLLVVVEHSSTPEVKQVCIFEAALVYRESSSPCLRSLLGIRELFV